MAKNNEFSKIISWKLPVQALGDGLWDSETQLHYGRYVLYVSVEAEHHQIIFPLPLWRNLVDCFLRLCMSYSEQRYLTVAPLWYK